jgi:hypothetical protein
VTCSQASVGSTTTGWQESLQPGQHTLVIEAGGDERWRVTATYVTVTATAWKVNAAGQTYGVENAHGSPDLIAVIATNGVQGYVYGRDLNPPMPTSLQTVPPDSPRRTLPVFASDGRTRVGEFVLGWRLAAPLSLGAPTYLDLRINRRYLQVL